MNDENNTSNENASPNGHVKEFCIEYLTRKKKVDYAIWLKGSWGCGKTFLYQDIKKTIMGQYSIGEDDILYISLFGCSSIAEVQDKIFLNCFPFGENVVAKTIANIIGNTNFKMMGCRINTGNINLKDFKNLFGKKFRKRKIWVFDDIERSDISPIELLGFFYNILENDDIKLLLIGDEEEYGKKFSSENYMQENTEKILKTSEKKSSSTTSQQSTSITNPENIPSEKSLYHMMCEKVVPYSIAVKPEKEVAIKKFVEDVKGKIDIDDIEKKLNSLANDLNMDNLRIVKRSLDSFVDFYKKIDKQYLNKVDYKEDIFKYYMVIQMQHLRGDLYDEKEETYKKNLYRALMEVQFYNGDYENFPKKKKEYDTSTYETKKDILIARDLWYELIINLNHKKDFINSIIKEDYNRKFAVKEPSTARDKVMYYYDNMDSENLKSSFECWVEEFKGKTHLNYNEILEFIYTINFFAREELICGDKEKYCQSIIEKLICKYEDALSLENAKNHEVKTSFKRIGKSANNENLIIKLEQCHQKVINNYPLKILANSLETDSEYLFEDIINNRCLQTLLEKLPIIKSIDNDLLWQWLLKKSVDTQWQLVKFLEERYQKDDINGSLPTEYYDDYDNVKKLYIKYQEEYEKQEGSFNMKKLFYKKISEAYKELLDYMYKHINPQPVETSS